LVRPCGKRDPGPGGCRGGGRPLIPWVLATRTRRRRPEAGPPMRSGDRTGNIPRRRSWHGQRRQRVSGDSAGVFSFLEKVCGKPVLPLPGFGSRCFLRQHTEADAGRFSAKLTCRSSGQPRVFRFCDGTAQRDGFEPNPVTCPPAIPPVPRSASGRRTGVPGTGNGSNGFSESFLEFFLFFGGGLGNPLLLLPGLDLCLCVCASERR